MKKYFSLIAILALVACGKTDKKAELEKLKKQEAELQVKIGKLEKELAKEGTSTNTDVAASLVEVQEAKMQFFEHYLQVQGRVDANENVNVGPEAAGVVSSVLVKVGDRVSKGQVMARLDAKVLQQSIAELQSGLDFASTMYQKQKSLWDQKIGSEVQYLTAKNQKESLERKMATLLEQVGLYTIKSPINGTVDNVDAKVGQSAMPGMPLIRVVNLSNLKVKAEVAESYASKVHTGSKVKVIFPDLQDSLISKLSYSAKVIDPLNRTFKVECALSSAGAYRPNMVAELKISDYTSAKPVFVVPINTIQKAEDASQYVYVANNNKAQKKVVIVGKIFEGQAEIISGLNEGDKIITKGFNDLNEGESIKY